MGTSSSNNVGSSPRWKETRHELEDLANRVLEDLAKRIPKKAGDVRFKDARANQISTERQTAPTNRRDSSGVRESGIEGGASVSSARDLGKHLIEAQRADPRFLPLLEDCGIKVALNQLLGLSTAATVRHRTLGDAPELFKEYRVNTEKNVGLGLSKALDERFKKHLVEDCRQITDNAEKARRAMGSTLVEMLADNAQPDAVLRMSTKEIYNALRKTNSMEIVRQFYRNYLFNVIQFLVSSNRADISPVAEKEILHQLRTTYCDVFARELVKRARRKGWRPGEIPEKVMEWRDLLVEVEEAHA